ncbi:unnamed protein product [Orchesella dallaii]|uniref:Protein kinase domain-containing protein n=1 Tax=Orchesella dallaii TaxID=48710 RepID=A0ABP1QBA1_9HEXA
MTNGQQAETDLYGRRIASHASLEGGPPPGARNRRKSLEETIELTMGFAKRLQGSLDTAKKNQNRRDSLGQPQQEILTYAETLHKGLKVMWIPMVFLGLCMLNYKQENTAKTNTSRISQEIVTLYWPDTFIFWTTLLQTCISTTHVLVQAERFALFIKAWYRVLDLTKIEVSRTLKRYISKSIFILFAFVMAVVAMYFMPFHFPHLRGVTWVICIALVQPFVVIFKLTDDVTINADGSLFFQDFAVVGLIVYIIAILFSWLYIIQFMVFCRCFRKGLKSINQRIAMILCVNDEPRVGPNALRLTFEYIHKDYLGIATTGIKIGQIFSWTMCNYYLWAVLVMVVELGEIFTFAKRNFRKTSSGLVYIETTNLLKELPPIQVVTNNLMHLLVTVVCIFYVSHEGAGAHKEGKMGYELARYKGLVNCTTQLERNFIRSIWIIVTDKCQVHVSPGKFFGITYSTVMTVFATSFTYFVFYVQSLTLDSNENTEDDADAGLLAAEPIISHDYEDAELMIDQDVIAGIIENSTVWNAEIESYGGFNAALSGLTDAEVEEFEKGCPPDREVKDSGFTIQNQAFNKDFEITPENLEIDKSSILGSGAFGCVYRGKLGTEGGSKSVAVKTVNPNADVAYFKTLLAELKVMTFLGQNENVVNLIGACTASIKEKQLYVVVEFCPYGNLHDYLKARRGLFVNFVKDGEIGSAFKSTGKFIYSNVHSGNSITTVDIFKWVYETSKGLAFLEEMKVVHGDIAARNILLGFGKVAKISDFGLSKKLYQYTTIKKEECLLPWRWMAIESLIDMEFSTKSDVWSFATTMWEALSLSELPFPGFNWDQDFIHKMRDGLRMKQPKNATNEIYELMIKCWQPDPLERPTFQEVRVTLEQMLNEVKTVVGIGSNCDSSPNEMDTTYSNMPQPCEDDIEVYIPNAAMLSVSESEL